MERATPARGRERGDSMMAQPRAAAAGIITAVTANQQINGGTWNLLGTFGS